MAKVVGIGKQRFDKIVENNCFYIDKTMFIKEWWENQDDVTLITRPRRFGKTLNMDMVKCFFSVEYKNRGDLVLGLMVDQMNNYIIKSNRESGFGRYDIMLEPIDKNNVKYPGIVIEFKVFNAKKEKTLDETVENALKQIKEI